MDTTALVKAALVSDMGIREAPKPSEEDSPMLGAWTYRPGSTYYVRPTRAHGGKLLAFEECHSNGRQVRGLLEWEGQWMKADLILQDTKELLGTVRIRHDDLLDCLVSRFQRPGDATWVETVAKRMGPPAFDSMQSLQRLRSVVGDEKDWAPFFRPAPSEDTRLQRGNSSHAHALLDPLPEVGSSPSAIRDCVMHALQARIVYLEQALADCALATEDGSNLGTSARDIERQLRLRKLGSASAQLEAEKLGVELHTLDSYDPQDLPMELAGQSRNFQRGEAREGSASPRWLSQGASAPQSPASTGDASLVLGDRPRMNGHRRLARNVWGQLDSSEDASTLVGDIGAKQTTSSGVVCSRWSKAKAVKPPPRSPEKKDEATQCSPEKTSEHKRGAEPPLMAAEEAIPEPAEKASDNKMPKCQRGGDLKRENPRVAAYLQAAAERQQRRCSILADDVDLLAEELRRLQTSGLDASGLWARGGELLSLQD